MTDERYLRGWADGKRETLEKFKEKIQKVQERLKEEIEKRSYQSYNEDNQPFKEIDINWVFEIQNKIFKEEFGEKLIK